ncbi:MULTISPECIES: cation:proton antiporter [Caballeronia]|uniref:Sodium/hydrogen exchanger n=1 Tax=Caballeronia cordobensis TaxID=1353886 RepID=A0A158JP37_CABCO|nr:MULTISPECIES: cation:proton antiporter [Caballeronia]AET89848.1 sodium/hydrogen exchanger [Burkholderia sp. YI23]AQG99406.1 potassium transporter [Burkholderia sp. KK1]BAO87128.1 sodium/hydrogen exchanger [Burkholderia sp. RPE67]BBP97016.1 sodium:proton antiporter [Burkholderia sp. SFA1]MCE4540977.1 cation:proton antiporter [Caballeronia sp. PC1]
MHHAIGFIQDLAVIMAIAGVVTVLFHRLRQPVVLGYIAAGVIIGPYTPPFNLIHDEVTIQTLGELGVVFLMFSLGLEFSLRKLFRVGATAFVAALSEIVLMIWIGYEIGRWFDWTVMDSLFLGAMLAISSTTIIVKALSELGMKGEHFAQIVFGILIVEDILAIAMLVLLSGIAQTGSVSAGVAVVTLGKLLLFMTVSLVVGILTVPRALNYVAKAKSDEMLLVTVLGFCFGFCLLVVKLDYSIALGAFLIGAIMAESKHLARIEHLIAPVRDMFSAIFFVTIGLLLNPTVLVDYAWPIAVITIAVVAGKIVSCGLGTFLAGKDGRTAMRVGMSVSQIGEFSFIIASLGLSLKVTSPFLYPIAVAVSALTTLLTPYLIRAADPATVRLARAMPAPLAHTFGLYSQWLASLTPASGGPTLFSMTRRIVLQIAVNLALVAAIFLGASYAAPFASGYLARWLDTDNAQRVVLWSAALLVALPFLVAVYRKLESLALLLAEVSVQPAKAGRFTRAIRSAISGLIPIVAMFGVFLLVAALSGGILPPFGLMVGVLVCVALLLTVLWRWCVKIHATMQIALRETFEEPRDH